LRAVAGALGDPAPFRSRIADREPRSLWGTLKAVHSGATPRTAPTRSRPEELRVRLLAHQKEAGPPGRYDGPRQHVVRPQRDLAIAPLAGKADYTRGRAGCRSRARVRGLASSRRNLATSSFSLRAAPHQATAPSHSAIQQRSRAAVEILDEGRRRSVRPALECLVRGRIPRA